MSFCASSARGPEVVSFSLFGNEQLYRTFLKYCPRKSSDLCLVLLQVNPNSIAAKDGRIREGDRILQVTDPRP